MENAYRATYYEKMDDLARWFGMSVAAGFFSSLARCSCVNLNTSDTDGEGEEEAKNRQLMLASFPSASSSTSSSFAANQVFNEKNPPLVVENMAV